MRMIRSSLIAIGLCAFIAMEAGAQTPEQPPAPTTPVRDPFSGGPEDPAPNAVSSDAPMSKPVPTFAANGSSPRIVKTQGIKNRNLVIQQTVTVYESVPVVVQRQITEQVDGRAVTRTVNETRVQIVSVVKVATQSVSIDKIKVFDLDAKPIETDRLPVLLFNPTLILCADEGVSTDPSYLKVAKPGTFFVVMPSPPTLPPSSAPRVAPEPTPIPPLSPPR